MTWDNIERIDSSDTNVSKYVFTAEDAVAEAVLYRYESFEHRTVICCSTMSGCPVGCRFCGAGDFFARALRAEEIVEQVQHLIADRDIDTDKVESFQIMFMSMGEPMLNFRQLETAIIDLHELYPNAKLLISTSGPQVLERDYRRLRWLSQDIPEVGLQFSIHESTDEARNKLIPFEAKMTLAGIAISGERWAQATGRQAFFNYCAHDGNSSDEDADRLRNLFDPAYWQATVSVICERDEHVSAAMERQRELAEGFERKLMNRGFATRVFDPAGQDDIGGGCGQLWFVQDWAQKHPEAVRPSIGAELPVIHPQ